MRLLIKYGCIVLIILLNLKEPFAQGFNGYSSTEILLDAYFIKEDIIIDANNTFLNVLVIKNRGEQRIEVNIDFNAPLGWTIMSMETNNYLINPNDSILFPVRAAPSKDVIGEVGYSLIAIITERTGETLANAYCFIKIPKISDFQFRPITRMAYFDQQSNLTEIKFRLINKGNINEVVTLTFESSNNLFIENEVNNLLIKDFLVKSKTDTLITLPVSLMDGNGTFSGMLRVDMTGFTQDQEFNSSFWFSRLDNYFKYRIPETEKMLILELSAQNLLSDQQAVLNGGFRGRVLFENNNDLSYLFYKYGTKGTKDILKYSRVRIAYNTNKLSLILGDVGGLPLKYGLGKGGEISYRLTRNYRFTLVGAENQFRPIRSFGGIIDSRFSNFNLSARYGHSDNRFFNSRSNVLAIRSIFNIVNNHSINSEIGISEAHFKTPDIKLHGYGLNLNYGGRIRNTSYTFRQHFGSETYYGPFAGRYYFTGLINHPLPNNYSLNLILSDSRYKPVTENQEGLRTSTFQETSKADLRLRKLIDRNLVIHGGPIYERKSSNSFHLFDGTNPFTTKSAKFSAGLRINDGYNSFFYPNITAGYTFVTNYSDPSSINGTFSPPSSEKAIFNSHVSLNMKRDYWGVFLNYYYGPYSVNQELTQFYYNIKSHSIRIMPHFDRFLFKEIVLLTSKVGYLYDFAFKTSRLNLNNQLDIFMAHDFTLSFLNTFSYQSTTDLLTEDSYKYSNTYFEIRAKKEFNWNQPRIKYYDLTINLFKDLNGNLMRDANEPGVKDILIHISSIEPIMYDEYDIGYRHSGKMVSQRLLTGMGGTITYENIPRGLYKIVLENIGRDQDKFFPDHNEFIINVADDKTVYVPYLERNRIFGRVVMNRSQLSNLGRIEVSNLRVTATDSRDRTTSTLTDANGYFEMYVPSVDSYVVSISNIFQEHFNLRQSNFRANLNGFKQFEVNFVFDEIRRQIEFTPSPSELEAEIRRVGRTNLAGNVRDASTLQGLRAQVEIINNETSATVERTYTERATGRYNTSFITYDNYSLIVTAPGYWMHSERLALDPFLTIQDIERDVLLENIVLGSSFQLNNLIFTPGSSEIPNEALPELDRLIRQLRDNPNVRIRIVGHSDAAETLDDRNLSARRAEMVMRYMVQNGFSNIEFTGLEASQPIAPNDTEVNRRRNRRVEIIIVDK